MNLSDWDKSKEKLRKIMVDGIEEIKELAAEASFLTDATSNVVKLELDIHRLRTRIEKAQTRLGREVARTASAAGAVKQSAPIKQLIQEIRTLEANLHEDEAHVKKVPLSWSAAKAAFVKSVQKKASPRRKAALKKKSVTGKKASRTIKND